MVSQPSPARIDHRVLGAGTTMRFALLLVLMLTSALGMTLTILQGLLLTNDGLGCAYAAGFDANDGGYLSNVSSILSQNAAYDACRARYAPGLPWWSAPAWTVLLVVVAALVFWSLPLWKARAGRVVPVGVIDPAGDLRAELANLVSATGLVRAPQFVVDPAAATSSAVAFGRTDRFTICLHGGLIASRSTNPQGFRAVVLHELAHIRNRDIGITYATVALWRAFICVILLPYAAWHIKLFWEPSDFWQGGLPIVLRNLLTASFMVALVHLARADVLRSREMHADLDAVDWGADTGSWSRQAAGVASRRDGRTRVSWLNGVWRTHPDWRVRLAAIADPAPLFDVPALPMLLTGCAAALLEWQVALYVSNSFFLTESLLRAMACLDAGLVTSIAGIAVWRSVAHAALTGRRMPSGVLPGVWLGAGFVCGQLMTSRLTLNHWLPAWSWVVLLQLTALAVVLWWTHHCAETWVQTWRTSAARPAMLVMLLGSWIVFTAVFYWWQRYGDLYANGWPFSRTQTFNWLQQSFPPSGAATHGELSLIAVAWPVLTTLDAGPFCLWAAQALWLVPLLGWIARPTARKRRPAAAPTGGGEAPEPDSRNFRELPRVLIASATGGALCWIALVVVLAHMHTLRPAGRSNGYLVAYTWWDVAALAVVPAATATVVAARACRHRILVALVASGCAMLIGLLGKFLLAASDGCVGPLTVLAPSCSWWPGPAWAEIDLLVRPVTVTGMLVAIAAAVPVAAVARRRRKHPNALALAPVPAPSRNAARPWRTGAAVLCALALGLGAATTAGTPHRATKENGLTLNQSLPTVGASAVSPKTRRLQVTAWAKYGGSDLMNSLDSDSGHLATALAEAAKSNATKIKTAHFRTLCSHIGKTADQTDTYFRVPDPEGQTLWLKAVAQEKKAAADCLRSLHDGNADLFFASMDEIKAAEHSLISLIKWMNSVLAADKSTERAAEQKLPRH
jgi:Zn-dependent protease with chaperone function